MRSWIETAKRVVESQVTVRYERQVLIDADGGPRLMDRHPAYREPLAEPADLAGVEPDQKRTEVSFVNVMLSLTTEEAALIHGVVQSRADFAGDNHRRADEAKLLPIAKELTSALEKARAQEAQLADAEPSGQPV